MDARCGTAYNVKRRKYKKKYLALGRAGTVEDGLNKKNTRFGRHQDLCLFWKKPREVKMGP